MVEIIVDTANTADYETAYRRHMEATGLPITRQGFASMVARKVADNGLAAAEQFGAKAYIANQSGTFRTQPYEWE